MIEGFLNLNKPSGWTSHDCVAKVRRLLQMKRVGHGGTLDPAATGVLPIALGRTTRLLQYLPTQKRYRAVIRFGVTTTTDDLEGDILTSSPCPQLTQETLTDMLPHFQGTIQQIPPKYSAIQVDGKRLYELARAGVDVDVPVRTVEIYSINILNWSPGDFPELEVDITCGSGTYIRAIARDLGHMARVGATLAKLIRTESCGLTLSTSLTLEQLTDKINQQIFAPICPQQALNHLPKLSFDSDQEGAWLNGRSISLPLDTMANVGNLPQWVQICNKTSAFLGVGYQTKAPPNSCQPGVEQDNKSQGSQGHINNQPFSYIIHPKVVFN